MIHYFLLFLSVVLYFVLQVQIKRRRIERDFAHIPSPKELTGVGNLLALTKKSIADAMELLEKTCPEPITKLTFAGHLMFSTYDPEIVKQVLLSPNFLEKPYFFDFFQMEHGLFSARYQKWKAVRQPLNKTLNQMTVTGMIDKFHKHTDQLVVKFESCLDQQKFDLLNVCMRFGMEQIFDTMLETDFTADFNDAIMLQEINEVACTRSFYLLYHPDWIFQWTSLHKRGRAWHEYLEEILKPIVKNKKRGGDFSVEGDYKTTFINELMKITYFEDKVPVEALMDNLKTIILAGSEPLSIALSNVLTMLAIHPDIDQKVYQEIQSFYEPGKLDGITIKKFTYLDRVIQETLRLLTIVPGTVRDTMADTYIDGIGLIPKGTKVGLAIIKMHRDPGIWGPECHKFDPDNFLPEKVAARHPYSYVPFSGGARNCIGHNFAQLNLKMALIKVLSKYKFTTEAKLEDLTFKFCLSMKLVNNYAVQVHRRV